MNYIHVREFEEISSFLTNKDLGITRLNGKLEAFLCQDYSTTITSEVDNTKLRSRSSSFNQILPKPVRKRSSSLGDLGEPSCQKLLMDLILLMNESNPDYDFSHTKLSQFIVRESHLVRSRVNNYLAEICVEDPSFLIKLWRGIDLVVDIEKCEVFSYVADINDESFRDGCLWAFHFFFYNKDTMRLCYLSCSAASRFRTAYGGSGHMLACPSSSDCLMYEGTLGSQEEEEEEEEDAGDGNGDERGSDAMDEEEEEEDVPDWDGII